MQLGTVTSPSGLDIPRDGKGRPLITPADGGKPIPYTRASKFGDALEDTHSERTRAPGQGHREVDGVHPAVVRDVEAVAPLVRARQLDERPGGALA